MSLTLSERLEYQKNRRIHNNNADTKKYEKTENGFIMRLYRNMKSRITGVQHKKAHLYTGKELLDKDEFYEFAKCSPMFIVLFAQYVKGGFQRKSAPSPDRIDTTRGYTMDNIQWVTMSVNSSRGSKARHG